MNANYVTVTEMMRIAAAVIVGESYRSIARRLRRDVSTVRYCALAMGLRSKHRRVGA